MLCFMYFLVAFSLCRDTTAYDILNRRTHVNPSILYTNEGPLVTRRVHRSLCTSMKCRVQAVIQNNGGHTRY